MLTAHRSFIKLLNMYLLCHRPTVDFVFMRVVLNSAAGHHKLALLCVCQTLSLYHFNILSLSLSRSSFYSLCLLLYLSLSLSLVWGCNFIYHLLCPVANIGSKNTLSRNHTIWYRFATTWSSKCFFLCVFFSYIHFTQNSLHLFPSLWHICFSPSSKYIFRKLLKSPARRLFLNDFPY